MDRKLYVGNTNDLAKAPDKIYIGDSNDVARLAKKIYVGDSNNIARQVWPAYKWSEIYQRCEYILNSNRSEYIDTGIYPTNYTRFIIDFQIAETSSASGDRYLAASGATMSFGVWVKFSTKSLKLYYNTRQYSGTDHDYDAPIATKTYGSADLLNARHVVDMNRPGGYFYIDDQLVATSTKTFGAMSYKLLIWAVGNYPISTGNAVKFNLYSFKAYNDTTLIRDMVPCYRKSDTTIGLYDFANDVFYTNAGTGIFYKGPDVN